MNNIIKVNLPYNLILPKSKNVFVYEYDVFLKDENSNNSRNELISNREPMVPNIEIEEEEKTELEVPKSIPEETNIVQEIFEQKLKTELEDIEQMSTSEEPVLEENSFEEPQNLEPEIQEQPQEIEESRENEQATSQSKRLLKIQAKLEKEMEKQKRKEEKAIEKLNKKSKKNIF